MQLRQNRLGVLERAQRVPEAITARRSAAQVVCARSAQDPAPPISIDAAADPVGVAARLRLRGIADERDHLITRICGWVASSVWVKT